MEKTYGEELKKKLKKHFFLEVLFKRAESPPKGDFL
jgi:hypothetical protein